MITIFKPVFALRHGCVIDPAVIDHLQFCVALQFNVKPLEGYGWVFVWFFAVQSLNQLKLRIGPFTTVVRSLWSYYLKGNFAIFKCQQTNFSIFFFLHPIRCFPQKKHLNWK